MSTALAKTNGAAVDYAPPAQSRYDDPGMIQTLKDTVAKNTTDSEFKLFLEVCKSTGLNPFLKEIWCVVPMKDGQRSSYGQVLIMAGRDGYLRVANDHPMFDGMETRVERDDKKIPIKAVCTVWRKDRSHPVIAEAYFNEYFKPSQSGKPGVWDIYKSAMIGKVSEVLALKRSFSINGVVTEEEIGPQVPQEDAKAKRQAAQDAASHVAAEKIDRMNAGESYRDMSEAEPAEDTLEEKLQTSIDKVTADKFKALAAFGDLKKEIIAVTGDDALYYRALGAEGYEKSNLIPAGKMRDVYRKVGKAFATWKAEDGAKDLGV